MIEELIRIDSTFNEATFISKVDNIFIMILSSIMTNNLDRVRHFISDDLEYKYEKMLNELKNSNQMQVYEMPNIKTTSITNIQILENKYVISVELVSRYIKYVLDLETGEPIGDVGEKREEHINYLTFEKNKNVSEQSIARSCPGCGANISVNTSGKCEFCGAFYNQEDFDWILTNINTI